MSKLAATLGISGTAAALLLLAFQVLPPRDGGTAQAGTVPPAQTIPVRAWADPPRAATPTLATAATRAVATEIVPQPVSTVSEPVPPAPPSVRQVTRSEAGRPEANRSMRADRVHRRVAAQVHRARMQVASPQPARAPAKPGPVRMAGPVGDILHELGLD